MTDNYYYYHYYYYYYYYYCYYYYYYITITVTITITYYYYITITIYYYYFDIRVCHPQADSYKDLTLKQLYKQQENEKKRKYASRILEVEQGTFTPLVFSTTGGMGEECARYHARLAKLLAIRKGETYSTTVSWIRAKVSFALLRGGHFYA